MAISEIKVGVRKRSLDLNHVSWLAEVMSVSGQLTPITLNEDKTLAARHHRYATAKKPGWETIDAKSLDLEGYKLELAEIEENPVRRELTALEQGEHLRRQDEIFQEMGLRASSGTNLKNQDRMGDEIEPVKTTKQIAQEVGMSERTAQVYKQIANNLTPETKEIIKGSQLEDKRDALLHISRKAPEEQKAIAELIGYKKAETVKQTEAIVDKPVRIHVSEDVFKDIGINTVYSVIYADFYKPLPLSCSAVESCTSLVSNG